ncbi:c-type cytochrome biogenesis protein CcmI [Rhizobium sp. GCM10022189]|uniref:c-type cytochrome biogenesis protein CcmI n=1 Tax=Rhizobium sp. GCM10022189 TaxID=3252654 RepID=UPI003621AF0B
MTIWILFAVMTTAATAVLLHPLSTSTRKAAVAKEDADKVYRDQLFELNEDIAAGRISPDEYELARAETARRLFKAADKRRPAQTVQRPGRWLKHAIAAFLPLLAIALYVSLGSPELPSRPLAARLAEPGQDLPILVKKMEDHLAARPADGRGWEVIAPVYLKMGRFDDAAKAYRTALRLNGASVSRLEGLSEALMATSNGAVTSEALDELKQILALEPDNPRARFYIALSLEQAGQAEAARGAFEALAKQSPADAPWLALVNEHIARNGGTASAPVAPPAAGSAAPDGPTAEDVAAAGTMSSGERQQMIRGMVESLDARLSADPDNFEGWKRLLRSYAVLNDKDRAAGALKRGLAAFPASGNEGRQLLALARELGIATEGLTE